MSEKQCGTAACHSRCGHAELQLRQVLAEIQSLAQNQLNVFASRGDTHLNPSEAALRVILSKTTKALTQESGSQVIKIRRMRRRQDDGPISGEAIAELMGQICGCEGAYDCDCVSVENQARQQLWAQHNEAQRKAA